MVNNYSDLDPEIHAANEVFKAISTLDSPEAQLRVMKWAYDRLDITDITQPETTNQHQAESSPTQKGDSDNLFLGYDKLTDAFGHVNHHLRNGYERALVVAAFIQVMGEREDFSGREVNSELRNLGYASTNITRTMSSLIERKPSLAVQAGKGSGQKSRKAYRVTDAGLRYVRQLFTRDDQQNPDAE